MDRIQALADRLPIGVDVEELLLVRARFGGLTSRQRVSAGGSCRLVATVDGWVAVNLARPSDIEAVPAIVEAPVDPDDPWSAIERFAARGAARLVADRCQLLGVAAAVLDDPEVDAEQAATLHDVGEAADRHDRRLVVDLSSMWAGPLCARLLGSMGLTVIKVESSSRPDGARAGDPRFFEWLHHGHQQVVLDFDRPEGRRHLRELLHRADVVIEASRPRALIQLGIDPLETLRDRPGTTWVSITGYGREGPAADRVAFGDDAAVAGGLVGRDADGLPVFCGDAIADPLSGLAAAVAAHRSFTSGGGHLAAISMAGVARSIATGVPCSSPAPS